MIDSVWLRISSAVPGQLVTPITIAMLSNDRPSTLASTIASGRNGSTRNHSVSRNSTAAGHPSKNPDISPTRVPITIEISVASNPTPSEMREPQISSVSTERPLSSVPSRYSADGGSSTPPVALVTSRPAGSASTRSQQGHQHEEGEQAQSEGAGAVGAEQPPGPAQRRGPPAARAPGAE